MLVAAWEAVRRSLSTHERLVLAWPVARAARPWLEWLGGMGLEPPLVLAVYPGDGAPLRLPEGAVHTLHPEGAVPTGEDGLFERYQATMRSLPAPLQAALDRFDPTGEARILVPCAAELTEVGGRAVLGGTPAARRQLEDKLRVDAIWDQLGIARLPCATVALSEASAAHAELNRGEGTVWAGDNTSGIEAGAVATRHVFDSVSEAAARELLEGRCERVRVQPFVRGVPCSIQGIVLDDGTALTRPCEMLVLRDPVHGAFRLAGVANTWDPPPSVTDALRTLARRTGTYLREQHAWRGGFSVDAVATERGELWPTELNARMTAGLALLDGTLPDPSLELMERVLRARGGIGVSASKLEQWIQRSTSRRRFCHARLLALPAPPEGEQELDGLLHGSVRLTWTPAGEAGRVDLSFDPFQIPAGSRVGPRVVQALAQAQEVWPLGLPALQAGGAP